MSLHPPPFNSTKQILIIVGFVAIDQIQNVDQLREKITILKDWAESCAKEGLSVTVFQRAQCNEHKVIEGVDYRLIDDGGVKFPRFYDFQHRFIRIVRKFAVQAVEEGAEVCLHINSMIFPVNTFFLTFGLNSSINIIVQHHAEKPRHYLFNVLNKLASKNVNTFFFVTKEQAQPWIQVGILSGQHVAEIMECSSTCIREEKSSAREQLGLIDETPIILWAGNLIPLKDPLLVFEGLNEFLMSYPDSIILVIFRNSQDLLPQLQILISQSKQLKKSIEIIGTIEPQNIDKYFNAADIFVQGSHYEGAGIAVLDAIACGAIPVVTNIPSFKQICGDTGQFWSAGDKAGFIKAMLSLMGDEQLIEKQQKCVERFNQYWTMTAIIKKAIPFYFPE